MQMPAFDILKFELRRQIPGGLGVSGVGCGGTTKDLESMHLGFGVGVENPGLGVQGGI